MRHKHLSQFNMQSDELAWIAMDVKKSSWNKFGVHKEFIKGGDCITLMPTVYKP
jgi:hypothetical protein